MIDDEDADLLAFKWYAAKRRKTFYGARNIRRDDGKKTIVYLHKVIGKRIRIDGETDHKNRCGLDNTRSNLRPATRSQNVANQELTSRNTSGIKGVCFAAWAGKWRALIRIDGQTRHIGYFSTAEEAAKAYDDAARKRFGEFACVNSR